MDERELRERIQRVAVALGVRPKYHDRPVAREGGRTVRIRHELHDGERVVAYYGVGYRTLFWRRADT